MTDYTEFPALYHKERLAAAMQAARPGETREQAWERFLGDWGALQRSPFGTSSARREPRMTAARLSGYLRPGPAVP
jgi:hypothetical protein